MTTSILSTVHDLLTTTFTQTKKSSKFLQKSACFVCDKCVDYGHVDKENSLSYATLLSVHYIFQQVRIFHYTIMCCPSRKALTIDASRVYIFVVSFTHHTNKLYYQYELYKHHLFNIWMHSQLYGSKLFNMMSVFSRREKTFIILKCLQISNITHQHIIFVNGKAILLIYTNLNRKYIYILYSSEDYRFIYRIGVLYTYSVNFAVMYLFLL